MRITAKLARQGWGSSEWNRWNRMECELSGDEKKEKNKETMMRRKKENDDDRAVRIVEPVQASRSIYE